MVEFIGKIKTSLLKKAGFFVTGVTPVNNMANKTTISKKDIKHVAMLARLQLTEKEIKKFESQLSSVIDYVNELNEVDTDNIKPTAQTTGLVNVFRKDTVSELQRLSQKEATSGSSKISNGYFKVPGILEERIE